MPFTLSHAAAIIPLHKTLGNRVSLSALIIGSMTPDFPYFLKIFSGKFSHTLPGIVCFCLPIGIISYFIFHLFFKRPVTGLLPERLSTRLSAIVFDAPLLPNHSIRVIAFSIVLGALTHIVWDSFTHIDTPIVQGFDIFRSLIFIIAGHPIYLFKVFQHLSSLFGLLALWLWLLDWMKANPASCPNSESTRLSMRLRSAIIGGIIFAGLSGSVWGGISQLNAPYERFLFYSITGGIAGGILALAVFCFGWHISRHPPTVASKSKATQ